MKTLIVSVAFLYSVACQPVYIEQSEARTVALPEKHNPVIITGSWKKERENLYITFNSSDEYIVSRYINNRRYIGHRIESVGYYEITHDGILLNDLNSWQINYYNMQPSARHIYLKQLRGKSNNRIIGKWHAVAVIENFYPRPHPVTVPPFHPVTPDDRPVVTAEPAADGFAHKKRRERPVVSRPERSEKESSREAAAVNPSRPSLPQTK